MNYKYENTHIETNFSKHFMLKYKNINILVFILNN